MATEPLVKADPQTILSRIADEIEKHGHYNKLDSPSTWGDLWTILNPTGRCCVYVNPALIGMDHESIAAAMSLLAERAGVVGRGPDLVSWNDRTPTAEVLATLRGTTE